MALYFSYFFVTINNFFEPPIMSIFVKFLCSMAILVCCLSTAIGQERPKDIPQNGLYFLVGVSVVVPFEYALPAVSPEVALGYRFHQFFGVSVGGGVLLDLNYTLVQGNVSVRGDFLDKSSSPYYEVAVGYSHPAGVHPLLLEGDFSNKKGGLYFRPCIGVRFGSKRAGHTFVDAGISLYSLGYTHTWQVDYLPEKREEISINNLGISIRAGTIF